MDVDLAPIEEKYNTFYTSLMFSFDMALPKITNTVFKNLNK